MAARTHHPAVVRIDSSRYGIVVSCHRFQSSCSSALERLRKKLPTDAIPHLMYRCVSVPCGTVIGERVRIS
jgi:hypothetical protein